MSADPALPTPTLVRLEYLTRDGWVTGHKAMSLLNPARYVERLLARGKFGRATALDDDLQPTGQVWVADELPAPEQLAASDTRIPAVPAYDACTHCGQQHQPPYDGMCLV